MALYYPGLGYYNSVKPRIGKEGDFYTAVNLTTAFGASVARQLEQMWEMLGYGEFTVVEYGAGTGMLCQDILEHIRLTNKRLYDVLQYCIIEKSPVMRTRQQDHLKGKVNWYDHIDEISLTRGCVLSNELLDNLSVHVVEMQDELMEVFVDYQDGFRELLLPSNSALKNYMQELEVVLPRQYRTEINLSAIQWLEQIARRLQRGYVVTIDYGLNSCELYNLSRRNGTLVCYHKHLINDDPYSYIGEQDITAHVNFSALSHWGKKFGLSSMGLTNQANFLLSLGFAEQLNKNLAGEDVFTVARKRSFIMYTMLIDMGRSYKVLIQQKGMPEHTLVGLTQAHRVAA